METFQEPVIVVDSDGNKGTVIGAMSVSMGGLNQAGQILANGQLLLGGSVTCGHQRLSLLAEPGVINVSGDDGTTVRLDAGGSISIVDTSDQTRLIADARGTLTLVDDSGNFTIALNAQEGHVSVN